MAPRPDWNLRMVRSREARALLPKLPGTPEQVDWHDLRVGHLDTGFTEHPVFGDWATDDVWLLTADGLNLREGGSDAHDPLDYEGNPGHGTRTCSIVCGDAQPPPGEEPPDSEIGVAPRLPVVPCRIVNRVVLTPERNREAVAAGIQHCRGKGCQVISISLGIPFFPPNATGGMGRAVDRAYEEGAIIVAAGGQIIKSVTYPGKYARTIGVGGVTWQRRIWFDYDAGQEMIDVWAPAEGVLRADSVAAEGQAVMPPIEGDDPGTFSLSLDSHSGSYGKGDGTSYATVHVAAAAAMWLLLRQDEIERTYGEAWQRVEAFRRLLRTTAGPINGASPANGTGVLDIEQLLLAALPAAGTLKKAAPDKDKWA
jgi:subtilisin family serine protease